MSIKLSADMQHAVEVMLRSKVDEKPILDVNAAAEEVRLIFAERNVAREDIASFVAHLATQYGYPMELGSALPESDRAEA